jgi:hypothetical protein
MREDEELWLKKMRETLRDYSEPSAPDGWSRLETALRPVVEKRIRPYAWWAAAALILAVSGISLFLMQSPATGDRHPTKLSVEVTPVVAPEAKAPGALMAQAKPDERPVSVPRRRDRADRGTEDSPAVTEDGPDGLSETTEEHADEANGRERSQPERQPDKRDMAGPSGKDKLHLPVTAEKKRSSAGRWSVAASFSNAAGASSARTQDYMLSADMPAGLSDGLPSNMVSIKDNDQLFFEDGIPYLKGTATVSEIRHKQPVSFGLSVRRYLSKDFSVESGVTYTLLSSEGYAADRPSQKIGRKWHYVGVPLRGNWDFAGSKRFTFYLTAGGMVEKCVYGKVGADRQTIKPLQFSLNGGIGGQLNVIRRMAIYVEPGVAYFFDDGSDVETIRKETPLKLNFQGGVRFTY